jgi:hypothetical protein
MYTICGFVYKCCFAYPCFYVVDCLRALCLFLICFITVFHRMSSVVSVIVHILETLAARCALPALLYICDLTEDESVLAGVELALPGNVVGVAP